MNTKVQAALLPLSVVVAGLLIAGAVLWNGQHPSTSSGQPAAPSVNIKNIKTDGSPYIGQAKAPVTIAFWSDFQCPYCKAFELGGVTGIPVEAALPLIIKNYVDTGKVKVVFKDFVFLGQDSIDAGLYNRAMWKLYPAQYFAWRTAMYAAQDEEQDLGFGDAASIDALNAKLPGVDAVAVAADVKANAAAYQALMDADKAEAQKSGIGATPSVIVGTELLQGAYPYVNFETAINKALGK